MALCLASAFGFGCMAIFAKDAYKQHLGITALLALRFALAIRRSLAERGEWGTRYTVQAIVLLAVQLAAQAANVWRASLALLMFGLLAWLSFPIQLLFAVIRDFAAPLDRDR